MTENQKPGSVAVSGEAALKDQDSSSSTYRILNPYWRVVVVVLTAVGVFLCINNVLLLGLVKVLLTLKYK